MATPARGACTLEPSLAQKVQDRPWVQILASSSLLCDTFLTVPSLSLMSSPVR